MNERDIGWAYLALHRIFPWIWLQNSSYHETITERRWFRWIELGDVNKKKRSKVAQSVKSRLNLLSTFKSWPVPNNEVLVSLSEPWMGARFDMWTTIFTQLHTLKWFICCLFVHCLCTIVQYLCFAVNASHHINYACDSTISIIKYLILS